MTAFVRTRVLVVMAVVALLLTAIPLTRSLGVIAQGAATPSPAAQASARPTPAPNWLNPGPATPNALGPAMPPELTQNPADWAVPEGTLAGTRANLHSAINSSNVNQLQVAWTFPVTAQGNFGGMTSSTLIVGDTVYVQDMQSNVFALDRATGNVRWEKRYDAPSEGPNGVSVGYGMVFGSTGDDGEAFALDARDGHEVW